LYRIAKTVGNAYDCIFSNATTPMNQHIANSGWKNNENLSEKGENERH